MGINLTYLATADLESAVNRFSLTTVIIGTVVLLFLVAAAIGYAARATKTSERAKKPLFIAITSVVVLTTAIITGSTVFLNIQSYVGGPVHWHADIEFWACGNQLELRDPKGLLSNKIGSPTLHEHNDKRIHVEGVPIAAKDASLGKFMQVVGGEVSSDTLVVPLNAKNYFVAGAQAPELVEPFISAEKDGTVARFVSGQQCDKQESTPQVFVYQTDEATKTYRQTKLNVPADYTIAHKSDVPPGDCVIFEFGPIRQHTDKLCQQLGVRDAARCQQYGVAADQRALCTYREVE